MSSCIDWSYIGYGQDPIPGSPDQIAEGASKYKRTADGLEEGASALRKMIESSETITMKAMDEIRSDATQVRADMAALVSRYSAAATALTGYAPVLRSAQAEAREAARQAIDAKRRRDAHYAEVAQARASIAVFDAEQSARAAENAKDIIGQANAANAEVQSALDRIEAAMCKRDDAAVAAADQIEDGIKASKANDSWKDKAVDWAKKYVGPVMDGILAVGKWVWDNLDNISLALDIIAGIFLVLAIVNPAFAAAALAIKAVKAAVLAFKILKGATLALSAVKGTASAASDWNNGDRQGAVIGLVTVAATTTLGALSLSGTKIAPTKVITKKLMEKNIIAKANPKQSAAAMAGVKHMLSTNQLVWPEVYYQRAVKMVATEKLISDGVTLGVSKGLEWGSSAIRTQLPVVTRSEPCPAN